MIAKSRQKQKQSNVETNISSKEILQNEIDYLITLLYGLTTALNEKEESIQEHSDPELIKLYKEDFAALSEDFLKIAEQVNIRLSIYIKLCNDEQVPVDMHYFRLYKTLQKFIDE